MGRLLVCKVLVEECVDVRNFCRGLLDEEDAARLFREAKLLIELTLDIF